MRFPPSFLDELRARLPVSEVVGRRVKLRRQGREFIGLSPFNKEKTPSFTVNDQKGFFHDFSSGKHGDIFRFVMETEGLSFGEAVERLAGLAGLPVPKATKEEEAREQRRKTLHEILELAAEFFSRTLASSGGAKARGYLSDRGVQAATQVEFGIGYAPGDRFALKEYLGGRGVSVPDMVEAGLLVAGEGIAIPYDRFRDRIIIPIHDQRGRVVGFGGRALNPDAQPKYLNSPESTIFQKGSLAFNFHRARQPAHDDGSVIVVEGYMDAIALYQAGLKSVVASMGTAFTEGQIQTLWKLADEPIICFDGDRAGIAAAHRAIDRILPELRVGRSFRFAFLPQGQDPDDVVRSSGIDVFRGLLKGSLPLWDMLWAREEANAKIDTPDGRAVFEKRLYDLVRTIQDQVVAKSYYRTCRVQLSDFFWQFDRSRRGTKPERFDKEQLRLPTEGRRHGIQLILLGLLVQYPEFLDEKDEELTGLDLDSSLQRFYRSLRLLLIDHGSLSVDLIYRELRDEFFEVLDMIHGERTQFRQRGHRLALRFPIVTVDPPPDFISRCIDHFADMIRAEHMREELKQLQDEIREGGLSDANSEHLVALRRELHLTQERISHRDSALADEAKELRRAYLGEAKWSMAA